MDNPQVTPPAPRSSALYLSISLLILATIGAWFVYEYIQSTSSVSVDLPAESEVVEGELTAPVSYPDASETFTQLALAFGASIESGDIDTATTLAADLEASSQNPTEAGWATLAAGIVALYTGNTEEALTILKPIAYEMDYTPETRSTAIWLAAETYAQNRDDLFALEQLFSGPVWEEFLRDDAAEDMSVSLQLALYDAYSYAVQQYPLPQVYLAAAETLANLVNEDFFTDEEAEEYTQVTLEWVSLGEGLLADTSSDALFGLDTTALVATYNSKALTLDALEWRGRGGVQEQSVENTYQDVYELVVSNELMTPLRLHVAYNYADFMLRTAETVPTETLRSILSVFSADSADAGSAAFFYNSLVDYDAVIERDLASPGHPYTMIRLAEISPNFRAYLSAAGVPEESLVLATSE